MGAAEGMASFLAGLNLVPGAGSLEDNRGTLVNALLHHFGQQLSSAGGELRPGIVHRLDKDTSGVMVVARTLTAHTALVEQLQARDVHRQYVAVVYGPMPVTSGQ